MSEDLDFEFEAPRFVESWDTANNFDDGADHFFDALESLTPHKTPRKITTRSAARESNFKKTPEIKRIASKLTPGKCNKIAQDVENVNALDENSTQRRLSLKRKASPLKDRNEYAPPSNDRGMSKRFRNKPALQILPTIAESPVLLTKGRVRLKTAPEPETRPILKPVRKKNIGLCLKPLPKPPTVPEPFNLTETGKNVHNCFDENAEKSTCFITPKKPVKKKRTEAPESAPTSETKKEIAPFSFYERDKAIMRRKQERINAASEESGVKFEFRAKSPSVLKKEPFRPELGPRVLVEPVGPELSTVERAKRREEREERRKEFMKQRQLDFETKKIQELEDSLFIFKAKPAPRSNSSFISTTSSSKRNFFDSSVASSISVSSSMAFSFYERDREMLKRKEERMNQVDDTKHVFKAKEPSVLKKDPFWPELESRTIRIDSAPALATEKRVPERKALLEEKQRKREEEAKLLEEEIKKAEQEAIRKLRKTLEFKATSIKK